MTFNATTKNESQPIYNSNNEPIIIYMSTLDLLLKEENPADLIALYTFCYYTAKYNRDVVSTISYISKNLKWTENRVERTKKDLTKLGLIGDKGVCLWKTT